MSATNRDLIALVYDCFAINTNEIARHFGVAVARAWRVASALGGTVLSDDQPDTPDGPVENRRNNDTKGWPILWQCLFSPDRYRLEEVLADASAKGVDLSKEIS